MGNVSIAIVRRRTQGNARVVTVDITGSASYATNGDTVVAADIAKMIPETAKLTDVEILDSEISSAGHSIFLDRANAKIKFFNGTTEIANAVSLAAVTVRARLQYGGAVVPTG